MSRSRLFSSSASIKTWNGFLTGVGVTIAGRCGVPCCCRKIRLGANVHHPSSLLLSSSLLLLVLVYVGAIAASVAAAVAMSCNVLYCIDITSDVTGILTVIPRASGMAIRFVPAPLCTKLVEYQNSFLFYGLDTTSKSMRS